MLGMAKCQGMKCVSKGSDKGKLLKWDMSAFGLQNVTWEWQDMDMIDWSKGGSSSIQLSTTKPECGSYNPWCSGAAYRPRCSRSVENGRLETFVLT